MAGPAHSQPLLEVGGVELSGSRRVLQYGAATCNVLDHVETPTEYERKKANHGQPVDVWQLDLSVYNGSGSPLLRNTHPPPGTVFLRVYAHRRPASSLTTEPVASDRALKLQIARR